MFQQAAQTHSGFNGLRNLVPCGLAAAVACGHLTALQRSLRLDAASRTGRAGKRGVTRPTLFRVSFLCPRALRAAAQRRSKSRGSGMLRLLRAGRAVAQHSSKWSARHHSLLHQMDRVLACAGCRFDPQWPDRAAERANAALGIDLQGAVDFRVERALPSRADPLDRHRALIAAHWRPGARAVAPARR